MSVCTCVFITLLINCLGVLISLLIPICWHVDCLIGVLCEWLDGWNVDHKCIYTQVDMIDNKASNNYHDHIML